MRKYVVLFVKGAAMGAANVIPGVSGGTIAFITGVFEPLIGSLKSIDAEAVRLLLRFRLRELAAHVNLPFLVALGAGAVTSILSLARVMEWLFAKHPVLTWAFFFGLILSSVVFVGKAIRRWTAPVVVLFVLGTAVAVAIALLRPASENDNIAYVFLCGVVAICSMIIPGLSGSFVLLLMGDYMLVMESVARMNFTILVPLLLGCGIGLLAFSRLLDWVFRTHHDAAVALVTGFILGSLLIIWPWKETIPLLDDAGMPVVRKGETVIQGYHWILPGSFNGEVAAAVGVMLAGAILVVILERLGNRRGEA